MKRFLEPRIRIVVFALAGLAALAMLSAALRRITFTPARPFSFDLGGLMLPSSPGPGITIPAWRYILFVLLVLVIAVVIMIFLDPELRKRILLALLRLIVGGVALWYLLNLLYERGVLQQFFRQPGAGGIGTASTSPAVPMPVFTPPQINPWLVFAVSLVIALVMVLFGWVVYKRSLNVLSNQAKDEMADIAMQALSELEPGRNWDDAIVRAYIRMNEVVMAERGLIRQPGNTPREFAQRMERIGLPGEAARSLTSLFENVRYGGQTPNQADRDLAAAALSSIVHSCGRTT